MPEPDCPYNEKFVSPDAYDTYETRQQIMSHLLFYKAIIDEEGSGERISKYMDLVDGLDEGLHIPIRDPFHRAIAITFELVMQNHINPWNVDLLKFSSLYLDRIKEEEDVDFITAGKLMVMAWEILRRQTEEVMARSKPPAPPPADAWDGVDIAGDWYVEDESFDFTKTVVDANEVPLEEKIWRPANRKVTLFELVEAFDEARKEVEVFRILKTEHEKERIRLEAENKGAVSGMVHKENIEQDITMTWKRLERLEGNIPLSNICHPGDREDKITTLVSCLFLAKDNKIKIWQVNFPFGEIYIKHITNGNGGPSVDEHVKESIQLISKPKAKGKKASAKAAPKKEAAEAPENEEPDEDAPDFPEDLEAPADPEAANQAPEKEARKSRFGRKAMADAKKTGRKSDT
jgi:segregation and condensation protein A